MELQEAGELHTPLEQQINKIERMFDEAKQRPVHPTNPSIEALEILPVLPNVKLWGNKFVAFLTFHYHALSYASIIQIYTAHVRLRSNTGTTKTKRSK